MLLIPGPQGERGCVLSKVRNVRGEYLSLKRLQGTNSQTKKQQQQQENNKTQVPLNFRFPVASGRDKVKACFQGTTF